MSDSVNDYGLGAPNTQTGESDERVYDTDETVAYDTDDTRGVEYGSRVTDGPYVGESALEEEGARYGLGDENTQEGDVVRDDRDIDMQYQPGMRPVENGKESEDRI